MVSRSECHTKQLGQTTVRNRLHRHLDKHSLLRKCPETFCNGEPGLSNLGEIFEEVEKDTEKEDMVNIVYLDLKRLCLRSLSKGSYNAMVQSCGLINSLKERK